MFKIEVKQILGTPNGSAWSQVHHFAPAEEEKRKKRGELILLVSIGLSSPAQESSNLGREIISRFHEEYFGDLEKDLMVSLKSALAKVGQEKSQYFDTPEEVSLLAMVVWQEFVYLAVWGRGRILLRRREKTATLAQGEKGELKIASGPLKQNDLFFLATEDFFEKIPQGIITASFSTEDLETIVEILTPVVHAREKQGSLAAVLAKAASASEEIVKPVLREKPKFRIDLIKIQQRLFRGKFLRKIRKILPRISSLLNSLRPRASALTVAFGFLILLSVSVFLGWRKKVSQRQQVLITQLTLSIEEKLQTASVIKNLDPENSLKLIKEAESVVDQLEKVSRSQADLFREKIKAFSSNLGAEAVEPKLYYDLGLVAEKTQITSLFSDGERVLVLDNSSGRLIDLNLVKKSGAIIAGGDKIKTQKLVVFSAERTYLVDDEKVSLLKNGDLAEAGQIAADDRVIAADGWLGSLYLLDRQNKQIWKYPLIDNGLGLKRAWLKETPDFGFGSVVDMAINGHLWLLLENGRIHKFLSGREAEFPQQLPAGVGKAKFLSVAQKGETIAFWDEEKKIIWVFNKKGEFVLRLPVKLDQANGIALSMDGKTIFLFGTDKIFSFEVNPRLSQDSP
ncbi:MAG: hypothetical protein ABH867_03110 [Patescibacteria group bacterium]|nr:hypothetical protein [Patescibacteria group bacterium]